MEESGGVELDVCGLLPSQLADRGMSAAERRIYVAVMYQALADLEGGYDAKVDPDPSEVQRHLIRILPATTAWFFYDDSPVTWIRHETITTKHACWLPNARGDLRPVYTTTSSTLATPEPAFFPFSFDEVCNHLNLDKRAIRRGIKQWIALTEIGIPIRIGLYHHHRKRRFRTSVVEVSPI